MRLLFCLLLLTLAACSSKKDSVPDDDGNGIVGGQLSTGKEAFAHTVISIYDKKNKTVCTASLLSDSVAVTAAHCLEGKDQELRVFFGTNILKPETRILRLVDGIKICPNRAFRDDAMQNSCDIGLVHFGGGLPEGYAPAELLSDKSLLKKGEKVLLAGYGLSNVKAQAGTGILRYVEAKIDDPGFSESEILIDQRDGKGACHGDSGGPAYLVVKGKPLLWGVTNRGVNDPDDKCNAYGLFTSISFYGDWIKKASAELVAPNPQN